MDELISKESVLRALKKIEVEPGISKAECVITDAPAVDAIPVQWMVDVIKDDFWARSDVMKMIDAWHYHVKTNK